MAYTTNELIARAYYLSGIVARSLQTVSGEQMTDGLSLLNSFIADKTAGTNLIPYYKQYDFTFSADVQDYFIPNLVDAQTFTFFIGDVRYSSAVTNRKAFFGTGRVENVSSLPVSYHFERELGGSRLWLYFYPQDNYDATIWGKFSLSSVVLGQNLELTLDKFYIDYLRYGLASYICDENLVSLPPQTAKRLKELEAIIQNISPADMSLMHLSNLTGTGGLNFGDVNIGRGYRPGY